MAFSDEGTAAATRSDYIDDPDTAFPGGKKIGEIRRDAALEEGGVGSGINPEFGGGGEPAKIDLWLDLSPVRFVDGQRIELEDPHVDVGNVFDEQRKGDFISGSENGGRVGGELEIDTVAEGGELQRSERFQESLRFRFSCEDACFGVKGPEVIFREKLSEALGRAFVLEEMDEESADEGVVIIDRTKACSSGEVVAEVGDRKAAV